MARAASTHLFGQRTATGMIGAANHTLTHHGHRTKYDGRESGPHLLITR